MFLSIATFYASRITKKVRSEYVQWIAGNTRKSCGNESTSRKLIIIIIFFFNEVENITIFLIGMC